MLKLLKNIILSLGIILGGTQLVSAQSDAGYLTGLARLSFYQYGVRPGNTAAQNTTAAQNAINDAHNLGIGVACDVQGTIKITSLVFYQYDHYYGTAGCVLQATQTGAAIRTSDSIAHAAYAQAEVDQVTFENLYLDVNNQTGAGVMLEACNHCELLHFRIFNVGAGSWSWTDYFVTNGTYPSAGILCKGVTDISGCWTNYIHEGRVEPATERASGSQGLVFMTSYGGNGEYPHFNKVENVDFYQDDSPNNGFDTAILIESGSDGRLVQVDVSEANTGISLSGSQQTVSRWDLEQIYAENEATYGINAGSNSNGYKVTFASTGGTATPLYNNYTQQAVYYFNLGTTQAAFNFGLGNPSSGLTTGASYVQLIPPDGKESTWEADSFGSDTTFTGVRFDGTSAARTAVQGDQPIVSFAGYGYNGAATVEGAYLKFSATGSNWSNTNNGANWTLFDTIDGHTTPVGTLQSDGAGGIQLCSSSTCPASQGDGGLGVEGVLQANGSLISAGAAVSVSGARISYGGTTAASSNCGNLMSSSACIVVNIGGVTHYIPYY